MRMQSLTLAVGSALLLVAAPGMADHPSKNGEGWANMPNDIHNTRVETRESGDNESFREFVQYGEGADSVNRFASDDTQPDQANQKKGEAKETSNQGESQANNQTNNQTNNQANNQTRSQTRNQDKQEVSDQDRQRVETRSRMRSNTMSRPDRRGSDRGGSRGGGGRRGGGNG